jgi:hypothetical protein
LVPRYGVASLADCQGPPVVPTAGLHEILSSLDHSVPLQHPVPAKKKKKIKRFPYFSHFEYQLHIQQLSEKIKAKKLPLILTVCFTPHYQYFFLVSTVKLLDLKTLKT